MRIATWFLFFTALSSQEVAAEVPMTVIDAKGLVLGPAIDFTGGPFGHAQVPFRISGQQILLSVDRHGFGVGMGPVAFESRDCSGQPYFSAYHPQNDRKVPFGAESVVSFPGATLYMRDPVIPVRFISLPTFREPDGTCLGFDPPLPPTTAIAIKSVLDLNTKFTPPFRTRLTTEVHELTP